MRAEFEVRLTFKKLSLSRAASQALRHLERYDAVIFTSKHARTFFMEEVRRRRFAPPRRIIQVGPRNDLLRLDLAGKRLLFPRSALAPSDVVRKLRVRGTHVRVIVLYTASVQRLSNAQKRRILNGSVAQLYFKSPSGVHGFLRQFRGASRTIVRAIPARCIGVTTARVARAAGFERVFIGGRTVL